MANNTNSDKKAEISRRRFLAGASALSATTSLTGTAALANEADSDAKVSAIPPTPDQLLQEHGDGDMYSDHDKEKYFVDRAGSDFMVDVIKTLDIEYIAINPGSALRGLHESIVNYGENEAPELISCLHEEHAVAMAHGYTKVSGKLMGVACHGTVGLQHSAMALYNAWCDQAPLVILAGNDIDAAARRSWVIWAHSALDPALLVRDFTKWDDQPTSLTHFAESMVRACKVAKTRPFGPTVLVVDAQLQEKAIDGPDPDIPDLATSIPSQGNEVAVRDVAHRLAMANSPVIVVDMFATCQESVSLLVELAEVVQAPVIDQGGRMNFPNTHYLHQTANARSIIQQADVILGLEVRDLWGVVNSVLDQAKLVERRNAASDAYLISIGVGDLSIKANYQSFQRYYPANASISGDAETTLPSLIEETRRAISRRKGNSQISEREKHFSDLHRVTKTRMQDMVRHAWDASPISTARVAVELWRQVKNKEWAVTSATRTQSDWIRRIWDIDQHYQYIGGSGGAGIGYGAPASVGAALAHRDHGRLPVNIQNDGDLLYVPTVLWTAAHHQIPLLSVMHNNRAYHQEIMHSHRIELRRKRGTGVSAKIGNVFEDPFVDFAQLAKSLGVWSSGPITDPSQLPDVLATAIEVVEAGEPALVDVIMQPR